MLYANVFMTSLFNVFVRIINLYKGKTTGYPTAKKSVSKRLTRRKKTVLNFLLMEDTFEIRTYSLCELAQLYFPDRTKESASKMFRAWIYASESLMNELKMLDWEKRSRNLTPKQVNTLVDHFDQP